MKKKSKKNNSNGSIARDIVFSNVLSAYKDESYTIIVRCIEEALKDPEIKAKIEFHTRAMFKAIAEKL